jgi:hypothetical protein
MVLNSWLMGMCATFKWKTSLSGCRTRRDDGSVEAAGKDNVRKLKDPYDFSWGCGIEYLEKTPDKTVPNLQKGHSQSNHSNTSIANFHLNTSKLNDITCLLSCQEGLCKSLFNGCITGSP